MGTTIIFILFGSGDIQKWNNLPVNVTPDDVTVEEDIKNQKTLNTY